jgi:hypothetical protein
MTTVESHPGENRRGPVAQRRMIDPYQPARASLAEPVALNQPGCRRPRVKVAEAVLETRAQRARAVAPGTGGLV